MNIHNQKKLIKVGYYFIRKAGAYPSIIEIKDNKTDWRTLATFNDETLRNVAFETLKNLKHVLTE